MSLIHSSLLLGAGAAAAGGYQIERSLRFNSSDSAFLSRTPASAGNRQKWTWSGWVKRSKLGANGSLFGVTPSSGTDSTYLLLQFNSSDQLELEYWSGKFRQTTQVFRDCSAWYHIVCTFDTTLATAADRVKLYVNGTEITTFSSSNAPTQSTDYAVNSAASHNIGSAVSFSSSRYFDGYLADIHFIDGQALTPSSFTEVSATTGQLIPKAYTGSFGTNGFWLKFSDNSAATATTLGKDYSGNSNNWTPNNLSVTAGAGNDSLVDTPTSYGTDTGAGGEVRGNYATLNPLKLANVLLSNGNLDWSDPSSDGKVLGTIGVSSGKWYWECTMTANNTILGIAKDSSTLTSSPGYDANSWGYIASNGQKLTNSSGSAYGSPFTTGDTVGVAFDADAGNLFFYKNGAIQNSGTAAFTGLTSGPYFPAVGNTFGAGSMNFGQRAFAYTAPSGFKALCDTNLTAPVVAKPSTVMDVKLYTGNGSTQTISGLGFSPDLVWIKRRDATANHDVTDTVRGATKSLYTSLTQGEATDAGALTAFNSDGFSLGATGTVNTNNGTYAAWTWDAGTSTVTNTQGSITSSVRANASSGFSVVTYSGTLSAVGSATVGHGLNVAPAMIISKSRNNSGADNGKWQIRHIGLSSWAHTLAFDTAQAFSQSGNGTLGAPTSTVFDTNYSVGINVSGNNYVAYCFAPVAGYSSFGSYTGNGSADGPFVYTGFRPRWVMLKQSSGSGTGWQIHDTSRNTYNVMNNRLQPNNSDAESTYTTSDFLSNGFKLRDSDPSWNSNGQNYIYAAFAENPFQFSRAR